MSMQNNSDSMLVLFGFLAVAAVLVVLFVVAPEMKNVAGAGNNLARASMSTNATRDGIMRDWFRKMHASTTGKGKKGGDPFADELYAVGGAYDTFSVPYGPDEVDLYVGKPTKAMSDTSWVKDYGTGKPIPLEAIKQYKFYTPYTRKTIYNKARGHLPASDWMKKFKNPSDKSVTNSARVGHSSHPLHKTSRFSHGTPGYTGGGIGPVEI